MEPNYGSRNIETEKNRPTIIFVQKAARGQRHKHVRSSSED